MTLVNINPNTTVKISSESRALLERAHKDGLTVLYSYILKYPTRDSEYTYFEYSTDNTSSCGYSFSRTMFAHKDDVITVDQLKEMLYPSTKHQLKNGDATPITKTSYTLIREIAKNYNVPLFPSMEEDSFEKELSLGSPYYRFDGHRIIRNDTDINKLSLDEFILKMMGLSKPSSIGVKLNESYTATVTKDSIKVGCQTFPHSIIKEIQKAIKEITE